MRLLRPLNAWILSSALLAAAVLLSAVGGAAEPQGTERPAPTAEQVAFFENKVRPLLYNQCVPCHSEQVKSGGVRLDTAADALRTLTPGDASKSNLFHVVEYNGKIKMPPDGKLPAAQIQVLKDWIQMGAPWPAASVNAKASAEDRTRWWAFQPIKSPKVPVVRNTAWVKSPVDAFVLAPLEAKGVTPAPAAGKRALIRRAYFDLIGLAPTPAQVEAFVQDKSPNAFEKVIDGLLASPHYGERWARHWLDVARYADSNGLDENKAFAYAFRYRDWVVRATNIDKPYDLFLQEQIAGDLMDSIGIEELRNERITATGFLMLGAKVLAEQDKPRMVMDIVDEQIDVTSKATMGLTIACARCHDHKFDPISTKDYYALAGIFKSTKTMRNLNFVSQWNERMLTTQELEAERRRRLAEVKPYEKAASEARRAAGNEISNGLRRDVAKYAKAGAELARQPGVMLSVAELAERPGDPARLTLEAVKFVRGNAVRDTDNFGKNLGVIITDKSPVNAEWDFDLPAEGRYQLELRYAAEESRPVKIRINGREVNKNAAGSVTGGWGPDSQRWEAVGIYEFLKGKNTLRIERAQALPHISRILIVPSRRPDSVASGAKPLTAKDIASREKLNEEVLLRFAARLQDIPALDDSRISALLSDKTLFAPPQKPEALYSPDSKKAVEAADEKLAAVQARVPEIPTVMAVEDAPKIEDVKVHLRGDTQLLGDTVPRGFPVVLNRGSGRNGEYEISARSSGRLEFARWLTRPDHPLTSRVAVNRIWQHLFGVGLVTTPDNWGLKGEKPSHPELLDYLARTFSTTDGWSQKKFLKRLMMSSAYQMATVSPYAAKAVAVDPENRLLWRMNRRRLEAEPLRDAVLQIAGKLDTTLGGSLLTTANDNYVTDDQSRDRALYDAPRRSLYLPVIRNSVYGLFQAFDFGDATAVNAVRSSTTVAPQALFLLNSPLVREASETFAQSLLTDKSTATNERRRVQMLYYRALGRPATEDDLLRASFFLNRYETTLATVEPDAAKRRKRAWQSLCQAILSSNEFIYLN